MVNQRLIIADIHHDLQWLGRILRKHPKTPVTFTGDWFDPKGGLASYFEVASSMGKVSEDRECEFLLGNHDAPYLLSAIGGDGYALYCSQFDPGQVQSVVGGWQQGGFDPHCIRVHTKILPDVLAVHGGFCPLFKERLGADDFERFGNAVEACSNSSALVRYVSFNRGGPDPYGGCTWFDARDAIHYCEDTFGQTQIVGHSRFKNQLTILTARDKTRMIFMDGGQTIYGVLQDRTLTVQRPDGEEFAVLLCDLGGQRTETKTNRFEIKL